MQVNIIEIWVLQYIVAIKWTISLLPSTKDFRQVLDENIIKVICNELTDVAKKTE